MGRHNKRPTTGGDVIDKDHLDDSDISNPAVDRLGLNNTVCYKCSANNPTDADSCRKCGGDVRPKKKRYADA